MSLGDGNSIDWMIEQKRVLDAYFTQAIQDAAGASEIRRAPVTGPDWPNRHDYANRAEFRKACAKWRKGQPA